MHSGEIPSHLTHRICDITEDDFFIVRDRGCVFKLNKINKELIGECMSQHYLSLNVQF